MYLTTNMINESNRNIQLRLNESNRNIQLRIDESNSNIQLRLDELSEKIKTQLLNAPVSFVLTDEIVEEKEVATRVAYIKQRNGL